MGAQTSPQRSALQTETAQFWMSTAPQLWNQTVQQLASAHRLGTTDTAVVFLLLNAAGADAMIAAWDSKYTYNQWRPVTAIRAQFPEAAWTPLIPTPPFPLATAITCLMPGMRVAAIPAPAPPGAA